MQSAVQLEQYSVALPTHRPSPHVVTQSRSIRTQLTRQMPSPSTHAPVSCASSALPKPTRPQLARTTTTAIRTSRGYRGGASRGYFEPWQGSFGADDEDRLLG